MDSLLNPSFFTDEFLESMDMRLGCNWHSVVVDSMKDQNGIERNASSTKANQNMGRGGGGGIALPGTLCFQPLCQHMKNSIRILIRKVVSRRVYENNFSAI